MVVNPSPALAQLYSYSCLSCAFFAYPQKSQFKLCLALTLRFPDKRKILTLLSCHTAIVCCGFHFITSSISSHHIPFPSLSIDMIVLFLYDKKFNLTILCSSGLFADLTNQSNSSDQNHGTALSPSSASFGNFFAS